MNIPVIFQFLKDLSANNNREWFNEHKAEYETARAEFDNFLATVIARISLFDETIRGIQPKDCTYRIYRDTRFSADKTPYKIHFGGYINAKGKKSDHCGYYVHLQPDGSMLAGGSLCLPTNILKAVRQSIYDNIEEFVAIVEDPEFKKYFPVIGEDFLKTAPHIQFLCGEFLLRQFQSSRRDCHREILLCGNAVLTLLHFIQKHFVVLVAVFVKAVAGVLQKYLT